MNNDLEQYNDKEFDDEILKLNKEMEEMEEMEKEWEKNFDQICVNSELFEELWEVLKGIDTKLKLLSGLINENIREQYLIDLFLSQAISIYEGFIHNFLHIMNEKSQVIDKLDEIKEVYEHKILFKNSKKDKASSVDEVISRLLDKTLNKPLFIKKVFEIIFKLDLSEFSLFSEDSNFLMKMDKALNIRNAHIHKNGIYADEPFSLGEVKQLLNNLVQFINFLVIEFTKIQRQKFDI